MASLAHELKTKVTTPETDLYLIGCGFARKHSIDVAARSLADEVRGNTALLRVLAKHYLETRILPDMQGKGLKSARDGHTDRANGHRKPAVSRGPVEDERGQMRGAHGAAFPVPLPSSPVERGGATAPLPTRPSTYAPPLSPVRQGVGHKIAAPQGQSLAARPLTFPKPNPPRGIAAIASVQDLFDTFKVRGGMPIGNLTVFEARSIAATNEREARVLRAVCDHVGGYVPPGTTLRQAVPLKVLEKAVAQNREASDA